MKSAIYNGTIVHRRLRPKSHLLKYRLFYLLIDLQELNEIGLISRFFSIEKRNILSFRQKDFGVCDSEENTLFDQMQNLLKHRLPDANVRQIKLLCIPRIFGYAFNPISVFYCYDDREKLSVVIYEVRNTFGEKHHYLFPIAPDQAQPVIRHDCKKEMFVSPFIGMNCRYFFSINEPDNKLTLAIRQTEEDLPVLNASFLGERLELTPKNLHRQLVAFPFNSVKVIAGIHWEALLLWLKKIPVVRHIRKTELPSDVSAEKS